MNTERREPEMQEPKEVEVSISDRFFTINLPIEDEKLIASVFLGLAQYVEEGSPIKVKQSYVTFFSSVEITTKLILKMRQLAEWEKETKAFIAAMRKRS
jgi:hypothetical protein